MSQTFAGTSVPGSQWTLLGTPDSANTACLSDAQATAHATPVPGCAETGPGVDGLQVAKGSDKTGGAAFASSVPTVDGLNARFNVYQWGADADQGVVFFLAATDPSTPSTPVIGAGGGHLGYSGGYATPADPGLSDAYLGVGLDVGGSFGTHQYGGANGCTGTAAPTSKAPDALDVRGPGNDLTGYCLLGSSVGSALGGTLAATPPVAVPVQVVVNPSASAITATGLGVPAESWGVAVTPVVAPATAPSQATCPARSRCLTGALPSSSTAACPSTSGGNGEIPSGAIPCSWLDAQGLPQQLTFGWTGATGSSADYHVVDDATVSTVTGIPPSYEVAVSSGNDGAPVVTGENVVFSAQATVESTDEHDRVTVSDRLPAGMAPSAASDTLDGGTCARTATTSTGTAVETCTYTPPAGGLAPGTTLTATFYATVSRAGLSEPATLTNQVLVGSGDTVTASGSDALAFLPDWSVSLVDDNTGHIVAPDGTIEFTATPDLSPIGADEEDAVVVTDTFPDVLVPSSWSGTGWSCIVAAQHVRCTLDAPTGGFPAGPAAALHLFAEATDATSGPTTDSVELTSTDGGAAGATASVDVATTALAFVDEPVAVQMDGTMESGGEPLRLQVAVEATGVTDTGLSGTTVTLSLSTDPNGAQFEVDGGTPTSTLSAPLEDGVATFPAFGLTETGKGYVLEATATEQVPATSTPFDSDTAVTDCEGGGTCTTPVTTDGVKATIDVPNTPSTTVVTANIGTTVALLDGCPAGTVGQILQVTAGGHSLVVVYRVSLASGQRRTPARNLPFCYGSTTAFRTASGKLSTYDSVNHEYEGPLGACKTTSVKPPCVESEVTTRQAAQVKVLTGPGDPRYDIDG